MSKLGGIGSGFEIVHLGIGIGHFGIGIADLGIGIDHAQCAISYSTGTSSLNDRILELLKCETKGFDCKCL